MCSIIKLDYKIRGDDSLNKYGKIGLPGSYRGHGRKNVCMENKVIIDDV